MNKMYLDLLNERRVRLAYYSGIEDDFHQITGKPFGLLLNGLLSGQSMFIECASLAYLMAIEGEKLEGKQLGLNEKEFVRLLNFMSIASFLAEISKINTSEN